MTIIETKEDEFNRLFNNVAESQIKLQIFEYLEIKDVFGDSFNLHWREKFQPGRMHISGVFYKFTRKRIYREVKCAYFNLLEFILWNIQQNPMYQQFYKPIPTDVVRMMYQQLYNCYGEYAKDLKGIEVTCAVRFFSKVKYKEFGEKLYGAIFDMMGCLVRYHNGLRTIKKLPLLPFKNWPFESEFISIV